MSKKMIGFGIIGCGGISDIHAKAIAALKDARIVAVSDPVADRAKKMARQYRVPWFTDNQKLLQLVEVDAVTITSPSGLHGSLGITSARAGKHVMVEKPIETTLEKADALIKACHKAKVKLGVISQLRFMPVMTAVYKAVKQGKFGRLTLGLASTKWFRPPEYFSEAPWRGTWKGNGGGCVVNQGIHCLDLLLSVMGPVKQVQGFTRRLWHKIETEDTAVANLEFENGGLGVIEATTTAYPGDSAKVEINGNKGTASWETSGKVLSWKFKNGLARPADKEIPWGVMHVWQFRDFVEAIQENREPLVTGETNRRALEVVLALYRSSREQRPVRIPSKR